MSVELSSMDGAKELVALANKLDRLYDTALTNALIEIVNDVTLELRSRRQCQCCLNETTRWFCDKSHQLT